MRRRLLRCIKPLGRHRLIYAMTSVHKLVFTLILAITVYSFLQVLFLLNDLLIVIIVLIIFLPIMRISNKAREQKVGKEGRVMKQLLKLILIIIVLIVLMMFVKEYLYFEYQRVAVLITIIVVALNYVVSVVKSLREKEDVVCDIIDDD